MRIAEIEANLRQVEGRRMATCLDVPIFAYGLAISDEDRALGRGVAWPDCVRRPDEAAGVALLAFLNRHLTEIPLAGATPGACLAFNVKQRHDHPDHVGVLSARGLVHLVLGRQVVELIPHGRHLAFMLRRARLAWILP